MAFMLGLYINTISYKGKIFLMTALIFSKTFKETFSPIFLEVEVLGNSFKFDFSHLFKTYITYWLSDIP